MNLRDLLLGMDEVGNVSVRGNATEEGDDSGSSDDVDDEEEFEISASSSPMQVLEYSDHQHPMEPLKLACMVQSLPPPSPRNKGQSYDSQGVEKKYPCRYCGEKFSTNYMLGNHVSRKHRHLSKIFKPQKPVKVAGQGQSLRKRGRPRKYPLSPALSSSSPSSNSNSTNSNTINNNINNTVNNINNNANNSNKYHSVTTHLPMIQEDIEKAHHGRTEGEAINRHLVRLMEILHELEISPAEKRVGVFERAPLFTSRLVALRALKQACDLELISTKQYLGKQEEFLLSFSF